MISRLTTVVARAVEGAGVRLVDSVSREVVDDIFGHALKKQTGVSLKYMLDFGSKPIERQLILSAQFLHKELPVRLAHRVAELENLPYGLSTKPHVVKVRVLWCSLLTANTSISIRCVYLNRFGIGMWSRSRTCARFRPSRTARMRCSLPTS